MKCKRKVCCWTARVMVFLILAIVVLSVKGLASKYNMEWFFAGTVIVVLAISLLGSLSPHVAIHSGVIYLTIAGYLLLIAYPTMPIASGALVKVSLNSNAQDALRFDVTLDEIPKNLQVG
jgi:hypothetical protein